MTVIAWDGETLAADRCAVTAGLVTGMTKIFKIDDLLVGGEGRSDTFMAMINWVRHGCIPDDFPITQLNDNAWCALLVVDTTTGKVYKYHQTPYPIAVDDKFIAMGSGADFAMAAMHCGKTAVEAVEIASLYSSTCGGGVDYFTLDQVFGNNLNVPKTKTVKMKLLSNIKNWRELNNLRQKDVANKLGIHQTTYGNFEKGEQTEISTMERAEQICELYNLDIKTFL